MLEQFKQFVAQQQLFSTQEPILLAFSGGIDSVTLAYLLHIGKYQFAIAHAHFGLRGEDSDADQAFAQALAEQYQVPFFTVRFDTKTYLAQHPNVSVQMAARQLRYEWLEQLRKDNQYTRIATAHHQNDVAETMLYNLTMGTGIGGLHGILPQRGVLVRPLLFADKQTIIQFAQEQQLTHQEDVSNAQTKYTRNKIRHLVMPVLQEINPRLPQTFYENAQRFTETELIYREGLRHYHQQICTQTRQELFISINRLLSIQPKRTVLFELLKQYGFHNTQIDQILTGLNAGEAGKIYLSNTHQLLRDRKHLIISLRTEKDISYLLIEHDTTEVQKNDWQIQIQIIDQTPTFILPTTPTTACLDMDKLVFPLLLRRFQPGDYFYPFGMKMKKKKVSRFFSDLKLNKNEKDRTWIIQDHKERIVWVVGHRIDERFKVNPQTQRICQMQQIPYPALPYPSH